ncbi:MAG TPA: hypothetical protein VMR81_03610 [Patescibacteria group bacterium]|nr:hypothetical protein [Patescibacteria group bacterium]
MTELTSVVEVRKSIMLFQQVLTSIAESSSKEYSHATQNEMKQRLAALIWKGLPKHVVGIDLGDQLNATRPEDQMKYIPLNQRETWDLPRIDQYAATLSESIKQEWKPIFPPPQAQA